MEPPECPVCLQSYDGESTVPRVLACGHSACETCLTQLPQPFPHTVRCPACTQLVKYPHPQGPSALPKNIDLLRLASLLENPDRENPPKPRKPREPLIPDHQLLPNLWSHEFYLKWKDWVIPQDAVVAESRPKDDFCFGFQGRIVTSTSSPAWSSRCSLKGAEKVSLVRIGGFSCENDSKLSYSYTAKILRALHQMKDEERTELELILGCLL
ncbi:Ubiquitin--protein ligase [Bertholletia excelsa]